MSIAQYLSKFAQGVNSQGVLSAAKGGTGNTSGGGGGNSPTVTAVSYPGDDTAADPAGGQTITLTGTNFAVGVKILIGSTLANVVVRVSSTQLTFTTPALSTGSYLIYVVNPDSSAAIVVPGLQVSPLPVWTTAAGSLGSVVQLVTFNSTVAATGDGNINYSIASGSLPTGLTLNSATGTISGAAPTVASSTTYSFTVRSTDAQNQDTDRNFSITVTPSNAPPTVEYLVVAGGGGGGYYSTNYAGGGGAGGFRTATNYAVSAATPYTVTVGAGGPAGAGVSSGAGVTGANSVFATITSTGGGCGANIGTSGAGPAINGGSGGGFGAAWGGSYANVSNFISGTGIPGQGNNGAVGPSTYNGNGGWQGGGGGGGAGAVGSAGPYYYTGNSYPYPTVSGGNGGDGLQSSITGTATWYAGGGGGSGVGSSTDNGGAGGQGGGGKGNNGGFGNGGSAGTANTGGGGGAGWAGGSGIVVIRYPNNYDPAVSTTGSPTYTNTGGYHIYKWTSSGSITF